MSVAAARESLPVTVIKPEKGWAALNFGEVWQSKDLLLSLAARDVTLRYRQTALGVIWVVLQPLLAAGIFSFVFGRVAKLSSGGVPYFAFSYAGLLAWNLFSNTVTRSSACLVGNAALVSKVYFPRLALPISTVGSTLIDFSVALCMMAFILVSYHIHPSMGILLLPIWVVMVLAMAVGLGLIFSALSVSYRDVQYVLPVILQFALYGSPVAYALTALKHIPSGLKRVYFTNPLVGILEAFRWSILGGHSLSLTLTAYAAVMSVAVLLIGAYSFRAMERRFADVV